MRVFLYMIWVLVLGASGGTLAQAAALESISIERTSPLAVYQSFIGASERLEKDYTQYIGDKSAATLKPLLEDLRRLRQLLDLREMPPATRVRMGDTAIAYLYDILARLPAPNPEAIPGYTGPGARPGTNELPLRWTIPGTDIQIARTDEGPYSGEYQFTAASVARLADYYDAIIDAPVLNPRTYPFFHLEQSNVTGPWIPVSFAQIFPDWLQKHYLNTPAWKILIISLINVAALLIAVLWIRFMWRRSVAKTGLARWRGFLSMPIGLLVLLYSSDKFISTQLNPGGSFSNTEGLIDSILYYGLLAWLAWALVYFLAEALAPSLRTVSQQYDESLLRLSAKLIAIIAVATILIQGADQLGIPALGLLAGFGIGGIAVALASQSTIENIFGGLSLLADRPFRLGDTIFFDKQTAKVLRIGPRSTRLRTRDGALCTVPNSDLAKMHIVNFSLRSCCYMDQNIALHNESTPENIQQLLILIRERMLAEDLVEKGDGWPRIQLVGVQLGQINIRLRARVLTTDYSEFLSIQELIMLDALSLIRQLNLKLAHPLGMKNKLKQVNNP